MGRARPPRLACQTRGGARSDRSQAHCTNVQAAVYFQYVLQSTHTVLPRSVPDSSGRVLIAMSMCAQVMIGIRGAQMFADGWEYCNDVGITVLYVSAVQVASFPNKYIYAHNLGVKRWCACACACACVNSQVHRRRGRAR